MPSIITLTYRLSFFLILIFFLSGCFQNSRLMEESQRAAESIEERMEVEETIEKLITIEAPKVKGENFVKPSDTQNDVKNTEMMAAFFAKVLYQFTSLEIPVSEYVEFLNNHASLDSPFVRDLNDKESIFEYVQTIYKERGVKNLNYRISEIEYDENDKNYAYFYREVNTDTLGSEYFLTTMKYEDDEWKLYNDEPTSPVIIGGEESLHE